MEERDEEEEEEEEGGRRGEGEEEQQEEEQDGAEPESASLRTNFGALKHLNFLFVRDEDLNPDLCVLAAMLVSRSPRTFW